MSLPKKFVELEPFATTWCLPTEGERFDRRLKSSITELRVFYDAFFPRLEEAIDYCDTFPLHDLPDEVVSLVQLIDSLIMVSMAVEIFGQPKTVDAAQAVLTRVNEPILKREPTK